MQQEAAPMATGLLAQSPPSLPAPPLGGTAGLPNIGGKRQQPQAVRSRSPAAKRHNDESAEHDDMDDFEGTEQLQATTATTFVTSGGNGKSDAASAAGSHNANQQRPARGHAGTLLTKTETIDQIKCQLQLCQQSRIQSALISDTGGVPLADPGIAATKKCLVNYSASVKGKPGHGLGPAFLHSFNEYANGVAADPLFAKLPQASREDWTHMIEELQTPIHTTEWIKRGSC
jgi:hypothetical protein